MFPIPFNFPFRKKNGDLTTISEAISSGGSSYELPPATSETLGGIKVGSGLSIAEGVLSVVSSSTRHLYRVRTNNDTLKNLLVFTDFDGTIDSSTLPAILANGKSIAIGIGCAFKSNSGLANNDSITTYVTANEISSSYEYSFNCETFSIVSSAIKITVAASTFPASSVSVTSSTKIY